MELFFIKRPRLANFLITIFSIICSIFITYSFIFFIKDYYELSSDAITIILFLAVLNPLLIVPFTSTKLTKFTCDLKLLNDKLDYANRYDSLTNIYNRSYTLNLANKYYELSKFEKTPFSILLIDYDFFKKVNDTYGHDTGDEVLKTLSKTISLSIRKNDIFGRYGGEEFLLICPNTNKDEAFLLAEKIRKNVNKKVMINENEIFMSISIGLCEDLKDKDLSLTNLISNADNALYKAKESGRNQVSIYK